MRKTLAILSVLLLAAGSARADGAFFHAIDDVPLMPGLHEETGDDVTFDEPEGRIVQASAAGAATVEAARAFYRQTLPQLGWRAAADDQYAREGERLSFRFEQRGSQLVVHVTVEPRS